MAGQSFRTEPSRHHPMPLHPMPLAPLLEAATLRPLTSLGTKTVLILEVRSVSRPAAEAAALPHSMLARGDMTEVAIALAKKGLLEQEL